VVHSILKQVGEVDVSHRVQRRISSAEVPVLVDDKLLEVGGHVAASQRAPGDLFRVGKEALIVVKRKP